MRHNLLMAPLIVAMMSERIAEVVKHADLMERTRDPQRLMAMPAVGAPEPIPMTPDRHPGDVFAKFDDFTLDDEALRRACGDFAPEPPPNRAQRRGTERKQRRRRIGF